MSLQRLEVSGLRNLRKTQLGDCGRINIISGPNGSGKTSLLEAIYLIGMGRSFRGGRNTSLINYEQDALTIYGELSPGHPGGYQNIGMTRSRQGKQEVRVNCAACAAVIEPARALPVRVINADSFGLVDGGPRARRQLIDWGVFHVKPDFFEHWRRAQRSLRQRNQLLKQQGKMGRGRIISSELLVWSRELAGCASSIDTLRMQYLESMLPFFSQILRRLVHLPGLTIDYRRGWREGEDLLVALEENIERDARLGVTTVGPHRANLDIRINDVPASEVLSRGQQKLVVSALQLAQGQHLVKETGAHCVYLIDDLPAELDRDHRSIFCELLDEMECQVFMTSVDADVIEGRWQNQSTIRRFHVEQGQIL